jgi:hypothetical protein
MRCIVLQIVWEEGPTLADFIASTLSQDRQKRQQHTTLIQMSTGGEVHVGPWHWLAYVPLRPSHLHIDIGTLMWQRSAVAAAKR